MLALNLQHGCAICSIHASICTNDSECALKAEPSRDLGALARGFTCGTQCAVSRWRQAPRPLSHQTSHTCEQVRTICMVPCWSSGESPKEGCKVTLPNSRLLRTAAAPNLTHVSVQCLLTTASVKKMSHATSTCIAAVQPDRRFHSCSRTALHTCIQCDCSQLPTQSSACEMDPRPYMSAFGRVSS